MVAVLSDFLVGVEVLDQKVEQELPHSGLLTLRVPEWLKLVLIEVENLLPLVLQGGDGAGQEETIFAPPLGLLRDAEGFQEISGSCLVLGGCSPQVLGGSYLVPDNFREDEGYLLVPEDLLKGSKRSLLVPEDFLKVCEHSL